MQKIKEFLLSINFTLLIFFTVGMRVTIFGASIGDALVITSLCGLQGFFHWVESKKQPNLDEKITKELSDIKAHVSGLMLKNSVRPPSQSDSGIKKFF